MKVEKRSVSSTSYASASSAYGQVKKSSGPAPVNDSVEVSASANVFQSALELARQVPDVRTEAISGIQQEVADGNYHRDETEVAEKVIKDYLSSP